VGRGMKAEMPVRKKKITVLDLNRTQITFAGSRPRQGEDQGEFQHITNPSEAANKYQAFCLSVAGVSSAGRVARIRRRKGVPYGKWRN